VGSKEGVWLSLEDQGHKVRPRQKEDGEKVPTWKGKHGLGVTEYSDGVEESRGEFRFDRKHGYGVLMRDPLPKTYARRLMKDDWRSSWPTGKHHWPRSGH
jgi:hypothetical protein